MSSPGADAPQQRPDGRQARWNQHNESRRRRIIDAAVEVIEAGRPGADVHVQQIASRAGLSRTVVYRHFEDRRDLDRAVQQHIIAMLWETLQPSMRLDGTVPEIIDRIVGTYVGWAVEHPALHRMADHDQTPDGPLEKALEEIAGQVGQFVSLAILALGGELTEDAAAAVDPLVYGIVGSVFGAVRRWLARPTPSLSAERLATLASQSVWFVLAGHAATLGVVIDPQQPVEELVAAALGA